MHTSTSDEEQCVGGRRRPFPTILTGKCDFDQVMLCSFVPAADEGTVGCAGQLGMLRASLRGAGQTCQ